MQCELVVERVTRLVVEDSAVAEELTYEKVALIVAMACHVEGRVVPPSPVIGLLKSSKLSCWSVAGRAELMRHER